jgi:hypothetical protein
MTVARPARPLTPLEVARHHVEHALGPKVAKRVDTFKDGTFYVTAGGWARSAAWLADFVVFLVVSVVGFGTAAVTVGDASGNVAVLALFGALIGAPILYGLCYGNGRALGAVLTGTRLVRVEDGGRIGAGACWAMVVRTVLFPILVAASVFGGAVPGDLTRISIDEDATRRLHAAGFLRLDGTR